MTTQTHNLVATAEAWSCSCGRGGPWQSQAEKEAFRTCPGALTLRTVKVTGESWERAQRAAERDGVTLSQAIRTFLEAYGDAGGR